MSKVSKFAVGETVCMFNSLSMRIESDDVYGVLFVPQPVEGREQDSGKSIKERLADGQMVVCEQYQLCSHQGIIDADVLFGSEEECKAYYRAFFGM